MSARTPEELDHRFAEALNAHDLDGLVALYEPQATLTPQPGTQVTGTAAIRAALAGFLPAKPRITIAPRVVAQTGDLALITGTWQMTMTGPDGKEVRMSGSSVEVARRQPDGGWLFAMDEPFGVVAP